MLDLVGKRYLFFLFSLLVIIPGVISLLIFGLNLGIDFTSGTVWDMKFTQPKIALTSDGIKSTIAQADPKYNDAIIQFTGGNTDSVEIRLTELQRNGDPNSSYMKIKAALTDKYGPIDETNFDDIGPVVGKDISRNAFISVTAASLIILAYIWFAFRKVPSPWRFGICAIGAMLHDVLVVVGIFSILGKVFGIAIDALFITAVLTVIGFSVHDTIVVFDRIRENALKRGAESYASVVNHSLVQTVVRSINTSLTVLFTLLALYLLGGITTQHFALTLLIGIASGTYSSIFNASMLLVTWENGKGEREAFGRFLRHPFSSVDAHHDAYAGD